MTTIAIGTSLPWPKKVILPTWKESKKNIALITRITVFSLFQAVFLASSIIVVTLAFIPTMTNQYFATQMFSKEKLLSHNNKGIILYDRNSNPFFSFYSAKTKEQVLLSQIPKHTQNALIAIEDKTFRSHHGLAYKSIARAAITNITNQDISNGGSTITQQLVKNTLLTPEKNFLRKYQEMILALDLDAKYSKDEILEMYFNTVYFGESAYGIQDASKAYFSKDAKDLSLAESAMLVGLLPAPSYYSPISNGLERIKKRQDLVLQKMLEQGYISEEQKREAQKTKIVIKEPPREEEMNVWAPHFALMIKDQLEKEYGEDYLTRSGFKVYTTLDLDWQKFAQAEIQKQVNLLKGHNVSNGTTVAMDPKTGEVRVLVGSKDWFDEKDGKFNVTTSFRPAGSAFKPFMYLLAFEKGIMNPATILQDRPTAFRNDVQANFASFRNDRNIKVNTSDPNAIYKPQNYDRKFRGPVSVRRALSNSLNIPAVETMSRVGLEDGLEMASRLGITTLKEPSNYGLSLVLGTAEVTLFDMTTSYATLANQGTKTSPTLILEIKDKEDKTIFKHEPKQEKVADEKDVFLISSILSDNKARTEMFGNSLNISRPAAVKTGTTDSYKDAWTMGYTPGLVIGVWIGRNDNKGMSQVAGSLGAAPVWRSLMEKFSDGTPVENFEPPLGVTTSTICASNKTITEYFRAGTEPKARACPSPPPTHFIIKHEDGREEIIPIEKRENPQPPQNQENKDDKKDQIIYLEDSSEEIVFLPY